MYDTDLAVKFRSMHAESRTALRKIFPNLPNRSLQSVETLGASGGGRLVFGDRFATCLPQEGLPAHGPLHYLPGLRNQDCEICQRDHTKCQHCPARLCKPNMGLTHSFLYQRRGTPIAQQAQLLLNGEVFNISGGLMAIFDGSDTIHGVIPPSNPSLKFPWYGTVFFQWVGAKPLEAEASSRPTACLAF
jgi:hypothetical protein